MGKRSSSSAAAGGASFVQTKKARISSSSAAAAFYQYDEEEGEDDGDSDDEPLPMSTSQLKKHSKVSSAPLYPSKPSSPHQQLDARKILDAKLERISMTTKAKEYKAMRNGQPHPSTSFTGKSEAPRTRYLMCVWRTPQARKHKTWDGDACLIVRSDMKGNVLRDANTKAIFARDFRVRAALSPGDQCTVGGREIEIDREISEREFNTGKPDAVTTPVPQTTPAKFDVNLLQRADSNKQFKIPSKLPVWGKRETEIEYPVETSSKITVKSPLRSSKEEGPLEPPQRSVSAKSFYAKLPNEGERGSRGRSLGPNARLGEAPQSRYDSTAPNTILMKRPDDRHQNYHNRKRLPVVDVMVAPELAIALRKHQVEGVRFLYERVMGMRAVDDDDHQGAILADDMGLGKTLQTITLIDMLLNQNCYYSPILKTIDRALIVCPLTLVKNWAKEFRKWLGNKVKVQCIDDKTKIENTINGNYQVLIIGYEKLLSSYTYVNDVQPKFSIVVCDEAHRLKNLSGKTAKMLNELRIDRRVLLTGTPIQNNMMEFHAMVELVAPNVLGDRKTFKTLFEQRILKSREAHCSKVALENGKKASIALQTITSALMLRRTKDVLEKFLPPKVEEVIFCSPSTLQVKVYEKLLVSEDVKGMLRDNKSSLALTAIGLLRSLCNSPELLIKNLKPAKGSEDKSTQILLKGIEKYLPTQVTNDVEMSGKLICLTKMLKQIKRKTSDKVVVVSSFTSMLDILEAMCRKQGFSSIRLDGKTKGEDRNHYVQAFNQGDQSSSFVFLLSTKAGGTGINLIGANRLILFDSDWNPSNDLQAMARIHRDGQKKTCYIYRMLIAGTMDEKIYQRQISKLSLSDSVMANAAGSSKSSESFTPAELRAIFQLHLESPCPSHDQMRCPCGGNGIAGAGMGSTVDKKGYEDEDDDDDDDDDDSLPPPPTFIKASQLMVTQATEEQKTNRAKLATLLKWAHYDCLSENSPPTKDLLINEIVAKQHKLGVHVLGGEEEEEEEEEEGEEGGGRYRNFNMKKIKAGSILYVYENAMNSGDGGKKDEEDDNCAEQEVEALQGSDDDDDEEDEEREQSEEEELDD